MTQTRHIPHIVIVGGGAGGLELAAFLSKKIGKKAKQKSHLLIHLPYTFGSLYCMKRRLELCNPTQMKLIILLMPAIITSNFVSVL
jgi:hypothetical protein